MSPKQLKQFLGLLIVILSAIAGLLAPDALSKQKTGLGRWSIFLEGMPSEFI